MPSPRLREELTTSTSWAGAIAAYLKARNTDIGPLLVAAGLDPGAMTDADGRYPVAGMTRLWEATAHVCGDAAVGVAVAQHLQPGVLMALGYAVMASETPADAFARLDRYSRIVSNAGHWQVQPGAAVVRLHLRVVEQGRVVSDHAVDAFMGTVVKLGRMMSMGQVNPLRASFVRAAPACIDAHQNFFGCPLEFEQDTNCLDIDTKSWNARLPWANASVAAAVDQLASQHLSRLEKDDVRLQARTMMVRLMYQGEPAISEVASALNISVRSLQRRLAEHGCSFKALVDETREELAKAYLADRRMSVRDIAFSLGFSDQSNFNRAFRRWTNLSPSDYRHRRLSG